MFGTGYGMSDDGTQVVIQGDRVLCPCGKNRVIAGDDVGCFVHKTIDAKPRDRDGAKILARSAAAPETYDEQYTLKGGDGRALAGVRYRIVTDRGRVITGTTNGFGETERIATDETERLKLYATGGVSNE
ncbi:hypothetical protein PSAC2689_120012 [Paraburkholderia sacchari]|uniref:hypothetical protein n=1 Tax=Paraburkholderia sacchari TaxID=159450 RepID=UPI0039A71E54